MKQVELDLRWPKSWQDCYTFDSVEIYGSKQHPGHTYSYQNRLKKTLALIHKVAQPKAKILDVAAAQGNFSLLLAESGYEVTWNDLRDDLVGYVQSKYECGNIQFAPGDVFTLDFESCFDLVLITEVIEHVAHPDKFISKIAQLVKPGGYIVMTTPNGEYFRNRLPKFSACPDPSIFEAIQFGPDSENHIFLLHLEEVYQLAQQAGVSVIDLQLFTNPLTIGHVKLGNLLRLIPQDWVLNIEHLTQSLPFSIQRKINIGMAVILRRLPT